MYIQMLAGRNASCNATEVTHAKRKPGSSFMIRTVFFACLKLGTRLLVHSVCHTIIIVYVTLVALVHNNAGMGFCYVSQGLCCMLHEHGWLAVKYMLCPCKCLLQMSLYNGHLVKAS